MSVNDGLKLAKRFIEQGWVKGHYAVDADGNDVSTASTDAVAFCAQGACNRAARDMGINNWHLWDQLRVCLPEDQVNNGLFNSYRYTSLAAWNDLETRTKEEVLALFDKAIAATEPKDGFA